MSLTSVHLTVHFTLQIEQKQLELRKKGNCVVQQATANPTGAGLCRKQIFHM